MIDEETFDLAQKRIATKHRPTKCDEIDLFSGLLFCGDCGYKMYLQQGAGTLERKHAYTCGRYRNRIRTGEVCTTHYIRKSVLKELVLGDIQRVLSYEIVHEFIDRILVYELDKDTNTRKVEIYYSFVGQVDTGEAHTESVSFFRQIGADVKSYAV